jgi:hypothetical protein
VQASPPSDESTIRRQREYRIKNSKACGAGSRVLVENSIDAPGHVFCNRGLADIDPKFEQFAVNPRCSHKGLATLISRMS